MAVPAFDYTTSVFTFNGFDRRSSSSLFYLLHMNYGKLLVSRRNKSKFSTDFKFSVLHMDKKQDLSNKNDFGCLAPPLLNEICFDATEVPLS
jgi:hypothetical protein